MKYVLEEKEAFSFYGITREFSTVDGANLREIPLFWQEVNQNGSFEKMIANSKDSKCIGACLPMKPDKADAFDYVIGGFSKTAVEGYDFYHVKAQEWAVFELHRPISETIHTAWKRIYSEWFPQTGFEHVDLPDFEVYFEGDVNDENYYMEIWIPIV